MNISRKWKPLSVFALVCFVLSIGVTGCPKQGQKTPPRSKNTRQSGGMNEQVFLQSVNSFNHLENHFGQDSIARILDRLDGWLSNQSPDPNWREDAFFAEQEKSMTALSVDLRQFADSLEKIAVTDANANSPLTPDDVQKAADIAQTISDRLSAAYAMLGVRHFLEYQQSVTEVKNALAPVADVAKQRNLSTEDIRRLFQTQFQQLGGNTAQLVVYFREVSDTTSRFAEIFRGSNLNFRRLDGDYLKQAFWCRSVSHWASGNRQGEIERARELFDWTVRNVMLQSTSRTPQGETRLVAPQSVWETLLFGKGGVSDWGYVFVELLRQHRIDACVLVSNIQNAQGQIMPSPWGIGVLVDGKVHVFLVRYGIPLVSEDDIRLETDKGLVFGDVATYDRLQADPALLAACLGEEYPVDQVETLLDQTMIMVPTDPIARSQRMLILEKVLTGTDKAVLFNDGQETLERFEQAFPGKTVSRWNYPFEAAFQSCLTRGSQDMRLELFRLTVSPEHPQPLWRGRILYLSGRKTGPGAATGELQHACVSERELAAMMDRQAVAMSEPLARLQTQIGEIEAALPQASATDQPLLQAKLDELLQMRNQYAAGMNVNFDGLQLQALLYGIAIGTANYWIGQIHLEEALSATNANSRKDSLKAAYDYVDKQVLKNVKAQQWRHGAEYHLGRVCEARGDYAEAVRHYSQPSQEPDSIGRQFRARQLQRLAPAE